MISIKKEIENTPTDGKKNKAKFVGEEKNGRGRFFRRIWCRLHRLPLDVEEIKERPKKKKSKEKLNTSKIDKSSKVKNKKKRVK